jgi:hypothetical protein
MTKSSLDSLRKIILTGYTSYFSMMETEFILAGNGAQVTKQVPYVPA